jgi:TonB-dependent starch-binding outer membrane protein SusC
LQISSNIFKTANMKQFRYLLLMFALILTATLVQAQKREITGKVTDSATGEPLNGVSVVAGKSKSGAVTQKDGTYTIEVDAAAKSLTFSIVSYAAQTISTGRGNNINISLLPAASAQADVVVIGYGTQKKSSVTGAVSKYKNEKLDQSPVSRLDQALQGKIAGVQVQNISSEAGADPKVQVRGLSSINAGQSPLVVVDGHPVPDGLAFVNMSDVESVEVLKDAASAAIYGSRGASGVILITTKSGKAQKTKYTFKTSVGVKSPYSVYPIMSTTEYTDLLYKEAALRFADTAWTNYATAAQIAAKANLITNPEKAAYLLEKDFFGGVPTDWQAAALQTSTVKNIDMSVSGGTKDNKYYISGAYQNDRGMMIHSNYERFNVRSKFDAQLGKRLKMVLNVNPSYFKRERPSTNFTDFARVSTYLPLRLDERSAAFVRQNPANANAKAGDFAQPRIFNDLPYNGIMPDGSVFATTGAIAISSSANNSPYAVLETRNITTNDYRLLTSGDLTYTIMKGFTFKTLLSAYVNSTAGLDFAKTNSNRQGDVSRGVYTNRLFIDLLNENTFNYTKDYKKHNINVLAGFTAQKTKVDNQQVTGLNFQSDNITTLNTALAIDQPNTFSTKNQIGLLSYLGRINYAYDNKYLLSASYRTDGSSYFGPGNKWGSFPSLSLGWVASNESFVKDINWISNLKLRGSYGTTGNNRIVDFAFVDLLFAANYPAGTGTGTSTQGLVPSSSILSNPNITWERTFQYNGGLDITLFKNLLSLTLEVYRSKTDKLLLNQSAMGITGVPQTWNNIGKLQNDGIELELSSNNIRKNNFKWTTTGNIARVKNKLLQLGNESLLLNVGERLDGYLNQVGGPLIQYYGFKTDGIWLSQTQINEARSKGLNSPLSGYFAPGALKFVDINKDNIIDLNDRTVIGNPYPDFTWGITNNFMFKGLDVSFTFQGVQGGDLMNGDGFYNEARKYNRSFTDNRWISPANPGDSKTPYFTNGYTNAWTQSDYLISSASYYALREVLVGYTLPKAWVKKMHFSSMRVYFSAQNLFFHSANDYTGLNIEARNNTGAYASPLLDGYQRGAFPVNRTVLFGIDLSF